MGKPSLQDHEAVLALNEERHFARAARRLGVTQPALTARLRRLEETLGARLFERGRNGVMPTEAGLALVDVAHRVLDTAAEAIDAVRAARSGFGVMLRIGMTEIAGFQVVVPALAAFRAAHPLARIRLEDGTTHVLERALEAARIDVAFLHPPLHAPGLSVRMLHRARIVLHDAGAAGRGRRPIRFPRAEAPVLMGTVDRSALEDGLTASGDPPVEATSATAALILSRAGYGPALLPEGFPLAETEAAARATPTDFPPLETGIAWRALDRRPAVAAFVDTTRAAVPDASI